MKFKISEFSVYHGIIATFNHESCMGTDYIGVVANNDITFDVGMNCRSYALGLALKCTNPKAVRFEPEFINGNTISMKLVANQNNSKYSDIVIYINSEYLLPIPSNSVLGYIYPIDGHLEYGE